jgi:RecA-family ATPase
MGAEDEADELHIRLAAILDHYEAKFSDVVAGGLHILSYVGEDCMLGLPDKAGIIQPTALLGTLKDAAAEIRPAAVMIDTVADVYGGSEIDRKQATQFLKLINGVAIAGDCSVAILAHPSVAGMNSGTGLSGSTAWHNKVRARAYMKAIAREDGDEIDPDAKSIQFMKSNYSRQGDTLRVKWQRGVYLLETSPSSFDQMALNGEVDYRFLRLLKQFEEQGRSISHKEKSASTYAPRAFAKIEIDGKKTSQTQYERAMQRMFEANKIHVQKYGPPSRGWERLVVGPKPQ